MAKPVLLAVSLSLSLVPLIAEAERDRGGSDGGGGRLGQVSSGLGRATAGGGGGGNGGGGTTSSDGGWRPTTDDGGCRASYGCGERVEPVIVAAAPESVEEEAAGAAPTRTTSIDIDFYAGAQKVYESDGSFSFELALTEGRFRIGGALTKYYEQQQGGGTLSLTLPALYLGYRVDGGGPTRVYLEAGVIGAETSNDPVMDSSVVGGLAGFRVEHRVSRRTSLVGDAQAMAFEEGVRAGAVRAGVRWGFLQASLRYLDLNVGPALFGPEVGLRF